MSSFKLFLTATAVLGSLAFGATHASAMPGLIILEGSDAQTFHRLDPYSTAFQNGLQAFGGGSALPTLAVDMSTTFVGTPTNGVVYASSIPSLAVLLATYSALYIQSPGGCCGENDTAITGHQADVAAFVAAGHSLAIENYTGGSAYNSVLGITAGIDANAHVAGYLGGLTGLGDCFDGNVVAPGGAAFGLGPVGSAVPNLSCFGHQAYEASFFDTFGFTTYIATNPGLAGFNVVISNGGGGLKEAIPEPTTMAIFGLGLAGLGWSRRRGA